MKRKLLILILFFTPVINCLAQSNKIGFKYYLTQDKFDSLISRKFGLKDSVILFNKGETITTSNGKKVKLTKDSVVVRDMILCNGSTVKCYINVKDGFLQVDPWSIGDKRVNLAWDGNPDPCYDSTGKSTIINSNSKNSLIITFPRKVIGDPTKVLKVDYNAWILNINTLGVKFRPSVKDSNNVKHAAVATGSNLNLGLTYGYSWGYTAFNNRTNNSYSFTLSGGLGFSTTDISKEILKSHINSGLGSELILSPSINAILARNDIGILFAFGTDWMAGKQASIWAYQGKPYFGLGIAAGFKL